MSSHPMNPDKITIIEEFDKQCGEVFLSIEGSLSFLCTLCGMKYNGYPSYANHIMETHCPKTKLEERDSLHTNIIEREAETEIEILCEEDTSIAISTDDFQLIDDVEFNAPIPDNCKEIEEFIAALREGNDQNSPYNLGNAKSIQELEKSRCGSPPPTFVKAKAPITKARRYRCTKCNFITKAYGTIMSHIARHFGKKRHFCEHCNKGFYTPSEVRVHTRIHTGERPYLCTECGHTFATNSSLWRHTKSCKNIRDKPCPKCDMKFFDTVGLRNHMVVHTEIRSYKCPQCNASFKLSKVLQNHMKIHNNKQEFKCRYCPASFNQQPGLISHVKNKHLKGSAFKSK